MKKIAVVVTSIHHDNTRKLIDGIQEKMKKGTVTMDILMTEEAFHLDMSNYDMVGFASGIYHGRLHESIYELVDQNKSIPKDTFVMFTSGSKNGKYGVDLKAYLEKNDYNVRGVYGCRGYDTFGLWEKIGGISKNHPNQNDISKGYFFLGGML